LPSSATTGIVVGTSGTPDTSPPAGASTPATGQKNRACRSPSGAAISRLGTGPRPLLAWLHQITYFRRRGEITQSQADVRQNQHPPHDLSTSSERWIYDRPRSMLTCFTRWPA
jgi:hypothetical protein